MTPSQGYAKSCATANGLGDGEKVCQAYLRPEDPGPQSEPAWRALISNYLERLASPMAGQRYVAQEFATPVITEPIIDYTLPITVVDNWPIGTGDQTGLIGRYASTLRTPVLVYQRIGTSQQPVLGPTWTEMDALECVLQLNARLEPALTFVLSMWAAARRVGPPWLEPVA